MLRLYFFLACLQAVAQQPPVINPDGVVANGGGQRHLLRRRDEISIYGRNLGPESPCQAPAGRLSRVTELCGTSVKIGDFPAYVISVQQKQINVLVPDRLATTGQAPVVVSRLGVASEPQLVPAGPYDAKVTFLQPAIAGMPLWVDLDLPNPPVAWLRYPIRIDPVDLDGHTLEVRREGVLLTPRKRDPAQMFGGGLSSPSVTVGMGSMIALPREPKQRNRLPLHLLYSFTEPGQYEVRYTGYTLPWQKQPRQVLVQSPWIQFTLSAPPAGARRAWLNQMLSSPPEDPVDWLSDYLPSLLALPDAAVLPTIASALHHPDSLVRRYTVSALRLFDEALLREWLPNQVRTEGPTPELAYALPSHPAFRSYEADLLPAVLPHLRSANPVAIAGTLQTIYLLHVHLKQSGRRIPDAVYHQIADSADTFLATRNRDVLQAFSLSLGTWPHDRSRSLLQRLIDEGTVREQAQICLRWIQQQPK